MSVCKKVDGALSQVRREAAGSCMVLSVIRTYDIRYSSCGGKGNRARKFAISYILYFESFTYTAISIYPYRQYPYPYRRLFRSRLTPRRSKSALGRQGLLPVNVSPPPSLLGCRRFSHPAVVGIVVMFAF